MSRKTFDSEDKTIEQILYNPNIYEVPSHQRDFAWDAKEIEDLWIDLINSLNEKNHFFGSMIIQNSPEENRKIILDGQQRLAAVTIILCAIRDIYYELEENDKARDIQTHYILDTHRGVEKKTITLNLRNKDFFYACIQQYPGSKCREDFSQFERNARQLKTNKLIEKAYNYFKDQIQTKIIGKSRNLKIEFLEELSSALVEKFIVIFISVSSEEDAYMIFETINERGLELSVADLFKNYLARNALVREREDVIRVWEKISTILDDKIRPFLRHYWSSKLEMTTERKLFSLLKNQIEKEKVKVLRFVKDLESEAFIYAALLNPNLKYWKDKELVELLKDFNCLNVTQSLIIFLGAKNKFNNRNFKKLVGMIINFAFRYSTICNFHNNVIERMHSNLSMKIRKGEVVSIEQVKDALLDIYPDDSSFESSFKFADIKTSSVARYIIKKLDLSLYTGPEKFDYGMLTLEHILPQSLSDQWKRYLQSRNIDGKGVKELINKIGNLTLLDVKMNSEAQNKFFKEKRDKYYRKSKLPINVELKKITQWNRDSILERQERLSKIAKEVWKI